MMTRLLSDTAPARGLTPRLLRALILGLSHARRAWRLHRRQARGVPQDLSERMMRDIGLEPRPARALLPFHPLW
ncbi:MAG: hypothetical protein RIG84_01755 [Roseovarius sp.]